MKGKTFATLPLNNLAPFFYYFFAGFFISIDRKSHILIPNIFFK